MNGILPGIQAPALPNINQLMQLGMQQTMEKRRSAREHQLQQWQTQMANWRAQYQHRMAEWEDKQRRRRQRAMVAGTLIGLGAGLVGAPMLAGKMGMATAAAPATATQAATPATFFDMTRGELGLLGLGGGRAIGGAW